MNVPVTNGTLGTVPFDSSSFPGPYWLKLEVHTDPDSGGAVYSALTPIILEQVPDDVTGLNNADQQAPDIDGSLIVWEDDRLGHWDIYMKDLNQYVPEDNIVLRMTSNTNDERRPAISGNRIVWQDTREPVTGSQGDIGICTYDPNTGNCIYQPLLDPVNDAQQAGTPQDNPAIASDLVVWESFDLFVSPPKRDLYYCFYTGGPFCNLSQPLTTAPNDQKNPAATYDANDNVYRVVWEDYQNGGQPDIYLREYDPVTGQWTDEQRIASDILNEVDQTRPAIADDRIIWQDCRNKISPTALQCDNWDLYYCIYDPDTGLCPNQQVELELSELQQDQTRPSVSYDPQRAAYRVAWIHGDPDEGIETPLDLYHGDLDTKKYGPLSLDPADQLAPALSAHRIVWEDYRDDNADIMLHTISVETNHPPIADGGELQLVTEDTAVMLNGSRSRDPDFDALTYSWTQVEGPAALNLTGTTAMKPTFTAPDVEQGAVMLFELVVNDGTINSLPNTVGVFVIDGAGDPTAPAVSLTSPNGGEIWTVSSNEPITWGSSGSISHVKLEYSTNGGVSFPNVIIGSTSAGSGSYVWTLPNSPTTQARVRITSTVDSGITDISSGNFTIQAAVTPTLTLVSPNGTEVWTVNTNQTIQWNASGAINDVQLEYSTDSGGSWSSVIASTPVNSTPYPWTVPNTPTTQARVRVTSTVDSSVTDLSNGDFTIKAEVTPTLTLVSPNGTEVWTAGTSETIVWSTTSSLGDVKLEYSTNGGGNWNSIAPSTPDDGSYGWSIPNAPTNQARVKITSTVDDSVTDASNSNFTIKVAPSLTLNSPNGGQIWTVGTSETIAWSSTGSLGTVRLAYSTNGGGNWTNITSSTSDDGSYNWSIPDAIGTDRRVKVSFASDTGIFDTSNSNFEIRGSVTLDEPDGGETWTIGSNRSILWSSSGSIGDVRLEYSTNGGGNWNSIAPSTPDDGSYGWSIPSEPTTQARVRVTAISDNNVSDESGNVIIPDTLSVTGLTSNPSSGEAPLGNVRFDLNATGTLTDKDPMILVDCDYPGGTPVHNWHISVNDISTADDPTPGAPPYETPPICGGYYTNADTYTAYVWLEVNGVGGFFNPGMSTTVTVTVAPPGKPQNLIAVVGAPGMSGDQVRLDWQDNLSNVDQFNVIWWKSDLSASGEIPVAFSATSVLIPEYRSWYHNGLDEDTEYNYVITAENAGGVSGVSNSTNVRTYLATPTGFGLNGSTSTAISVNFQDKSYKEDRFDIWRTGGPEGTVQYHVQEGGLLETELWYNAWQYGLTPNTTYTFKVRARNKSTGRSSLWTDPLSRPTSMPPP